MIPKIIVLPKSNVAKRKVEDELSVEAQPPTNRQRVNDVARIGEPQRGVPQAIVMPAERHGYHLIQPLSLFQERHEVTSDPAIVTIPALKVRISDLVNDLNKSKTIEEAVNTLDALTYFFSSKIKEHMRQAATAKLVQSNHGVGAILMALKKWNPSSFLLQLDSLFLLSHITFYLRCGKCANCSPDIRASLLFMVKSGCVEMALKAVKTYPTHVCLRKRAILLITNILAQSDVTIREYVTSDECIDMIVEGMKAWQEDWIIQHFGCLYFLKIISRMPSVKSKLREKKICGLFSTAIGNFPTDEDILEFADIGEIRMEYKNENSMFYSGTDYLGVATGVQLTRQEDDTFA